MASLIEGYSYDIFISYRQKDNKGDKWVSNFVEALKTELEATFKEDVSLYFDENPHDRLQETHLVDKSLEEKLKCLIFIPILSQTYCDPNCYAWQFEFLAFNRFVKGDRFGRDIRLRNGNFASRILPIRIHGLEQEDIKLFEKETGSVLRAMDFVFKTATGVNRPLNASEDHPHENLNKTFYSDQINKVAQAVKEIILGLKSEPAAPGKENVRSGEPFAEVKNEKKGKEKGEPPEKIRRSAWYWAIPVGMLAVAAAVFAYQKIFRSDAMDTLRSSNARISVAVMPFQNMTNDTTWNVWQEGIQDIIINYLSNSPGELQVRQRETINSLLEAKGYNTYASLTPPVVGNLSRKLETDVFLYGNIKKAGHQIRMNAQLTESRTGEALKPFELDGTLTDETILKLADSLKKMVGNFLLLSALSGELSPEWKGHASTGSPEAYRCFTMGETEFFKNNFPAAIDWFLQALKIDSTLTEAFGKISLAFYNNGQFERGKEWCLKNYGHLDRMDLKQKIWANFIYALYFKTPVERIGYMKQLKDIDDQSPMVYFNTGDCYLELLQYDRAISEFEKALDIFRKWNAKPFWGAFYYELGEAYHQTGHYRQEEKIYKRAEKDFPDDPQLISQQAWLALRQGDTVKGNRLVGKMISIRKENLWSDAEIANSLALVYMMAGIPEKTEEYYRKALSLEPENLTRKNALAYFLIDSGRNVAEGLEMAEKALKISPENFSNLHIKGWGLYKQGKYPEALELMKKSQDLRSLHSIYKHRAFLNFEEVKKAVAKNNNSK